MSEFKMSEQIINQIISQVDNAVKTGVNKILCDFIERHRVLEQTHELVLKLPSVQDHIRQFYEPKETGNTRDDVPMFVSIKEMTRELVSEEVDRKLNSVITLLQELKTKNSSDIILVDEKQKDVDESYQSSQTEVKIEEVENSRVDADEDTYEDTNELKQESEKENITLEIEEEPLQEEESEAEEEVEEDTEEVEDESEAEVESEAEEEVEVEVEVESEAEEESEVEVESEAEVEVESEAEEETDEVEDEAELDEEVEVDDIETEEEPEEESEAEEDEKDAVKQAVAVPVTEQEEEEQELFEIEIDDVTYCTNNDDNGDIYEMTEDGDVGEKIGYFKEGEPIFLTDE